MMIKKQTNGKDREKSGLSKESGLKKRKSRSAVFAGMIFTLSMCVSPGSYPWFTWLINLVQYLYYMGAGRGIQSIF